MSPHRPPYRRAARATAAPQALVAAATVLVLVLGGVTACGPFTSDDAAAPAAASSAQPTHHPVEDRAFPVTVEHRYGDTHLADPPARIVTLGVHDADTLVSLGVRPVGTRAWPTEGASYADLPWAPDDLAPGEPAVASPPGEIDFAAVAALQPDLITVLNSDVSEADYLHLTEIAPTIAQVPDTDTMLSSWQEETRLMGRAIGRPAEAETVIAGLEDDVAAVRDRFPVLKDADVALVTYDADRTLRLVNPYDPRGRLLAALGMRFPDAIAEAASADEFDVATDLDILAELEDDLDLVVWLPDATDDPAALAAAAEAMRADQDYADIDPVRNGASVFLEDPAALWFTSGPSLVHVAEVNAAALAEALGEKAAEDGTAVTPGPLPGQDPALDRDRAGRTPEPEASPTPSTTGTPAAAEPTAEPTGTSSAEPAPGGIIPGLLGDIDDDAPAPVQKRKPKRERDRPDQPKPSITG
jgi:iron complex transport system substrate-binding protein